MTRLVLQYVLPLILPAAVFIVWVLLTRQPAGGERSVMERLQEGPWLLLVVGGLVLAAGVMMALALIDGAPPGAEYQAPRLEDGRVVPGTFN